ncbi:MAG TPA: YfiR family protein [Opitutaceae bacterium]|nr:YfiR family protein [Opitutaceae bacterium]
MNACAAFRFRLPPPSVTALLLALAFLAMPGARADVPREYKLKAAFLFNFTKYVQRPSALPADSERTIVIGLLGSDPFEGELQRIARGRRSGSHPVAVRVLTGLEEVGAADLLFVPAAEEGRFAALAAKLRKVPVLTVGESGRFLDDGGVLAFVRDGDRLRFSIALGAVRRSGLQVSAQLLSLATLVPEKGQP